MKQVTRNIDPASAHDLLRRVPRACIAFATNEGVQAEPVRLEWRDNRYRIGVPQTATHQPKQDQEIVLLVDEGLYYFDLRAIYIRGTVNTAATLTDGCLWFEITPAKTIAWDYGTLREVDDEHQ